MKSFALAVVLPVFLAVMPNDRVPENVTQDGKGRRGRGGGRRLHPEGPRGQGHVAQVAGDRQEVRRPGLLVPRVPRGAKMCEPAFAKLNTDFSGKGVAFVHVASNKAENKVEGDVAKTKEYAKKNSIAFPILLDVDNKIADTFGGKCTPHVFVIDAKDMKVVYAGAMERQRLKGRQRQEEVCARSARPAPRRQAGGESPPRRPRAALIKRVVGSCRSLRSRRERLLVRCVGAPSPRPW